MSETEIHVILILAIVIGLPMLLLFVLLISGFFKNEIDKGEGRDSGAFGWVIAFIIAIIVIYVFLTGGESFEHFRHT